MELGNCERGMEGIFRKRRIEKAGNLKDLEEEEEEEEEKKTKSERAEADGISTM